MGNNCCVRDRTQKKFFEEKKANKKEGAFEDYLYSISEDCDGKLMRRGNEMRTQENSLYETMTEANEEKRFETKSVFSKDSNQLQTMNDFLTPRDFLNPNNSNFLSTLTQNKVQGRTQPSHRHVRSEIKASEKVQSHFVFTAPDQGERFTTETSCGERDFGVSTHSQGRLIQPRHRKTVSENSNYLLRNKFQGLEREPEKTKAQENNEKAMPNKPRRSKSLNGVLNEEDHLSPEEIRELFSLALNLDNLRQNSFGEGSYEEELKMRVNQMPSFSYNEKENYSRSRDDTQIKQKKRTSMIIQACLKDLKDDSMASKLSGQSNNRKESSDKEEQLDNVGHETANKGKNLNGKKLEYCDKVMQTTLEDDSDSEDGEDELDSLHSYNDASVETEGLKNKKKILTTASVPNLQKSALQSKPKLSKKELEESRKEMKLFINDLIIVKIANGKPLIKVGGGYVAMEKFIEKLVEKINSRKSRFKDGKIYEDPLLAEKLKDYVLSFKEKNENEERKSAKGKLKLKLDDHKESTEFITARVSRTKTKCNKDITSREVLKAKSKKIEDKTNQIGMDLGEKVVFNMEKPKHHK